MVKMGSVKSKANILQEITAEDALTILRILMAENKEITGRIKQITKEYLTKIDLEDIASEVFPKLDNLAVEDLWDQSGPTTHGYVDPADKACEMFEETLEPFIERLRKYKRLLMLKEAKIYCMGILKGIYQFEKESTSEFKNWAVDVPGEYFGWVLNEWEKGQKHSDKLEMRNFIKENFPDWQ